MDEIKRAKHRALYLLEHMDRTENELRAKLNKNYPPETVEEVIAFVKKYNYIDDLQYVKNYISCKSRVKSRKQMEQDLLFKKGVDKEVLFQAFEELEPQDERELIRKWMEKKKIQPDSITRENLQKFYLFLMRKGFQTEDIRSVLRTFDQINE